VYNELSSSKVLTIERLSGALLEDVVTSGTDHSRGAWSDPGSLANAICFAWARQAVIGGVAPVEPRSTNIVVLPDQRIAFTRGNFARFSSDSKTNLLEYLTSALADDADKACECLLTEMEQTRQPDSRDDLRNAFRQIVPFRDGGWS